MSMSILKDRISAKVDGAGVHTARVRPGIKVPTKALRTAAANNPAIHAVLKEHEAGLSSSAAEKKLLEIDQKLRYAFTPRNTPYFTVGKSDFAAPTVGDVAPQKLLDLYGEDRDGTGRHLWRIPMVFADSEIEKIFPSQFRVAKGNLMYESMYINGVRHCMIRPEIQNTGAKRLKMLPRKLQSRGECDPEMCPEFGNGACKFSGTLRFYIPGIEGIHPFVMTTSSTYAAEDIYMQLETIIDKLGRLPRSKPDGSPVFWLVKSQKQRTYYDENGTKKSGLQWVPDIVADVDFTKMLDIAERQQRLGMSPQSAPKAWVHPSAEVAVYGRQQHDDSPFSAIDDDGVVTTQGQSDAPLELHEELRESEPHAGTSAGNGTTPDSKVVLPVAERSLVERFDVLVDTYKLTQAEVWATGKFGVEWRSNPQLVGSAVDIIERLLKGGPDIAQGVMKLKILVQQNDLDQDLSDQFIRLRFGNGFFKDPMTIQKANACIVELLESGKDIAEVYMQSELAKVA